MDPEADCHTLETKAMSAEECKRHKDEIVAGIGRQEHFDDKYKVLWDGMKTLMTWKRMVIRIEKTSEGVPLSARGVPIFKTKCRSMVAQMP